MSLIVEETTTSNSQTGNSKVGSPSLVKGKQETLCLSFLFYESNLILDEISNMQTDNIRLIFKPQVANI